MKMLESGVDQLESGVDQIGSLNLRVNSIF